MTADDPREPDALRAKKRGTQRSMTAEPALSGPEQAPADRRAFVLRRLHSLAGVVPLGLFLALHLAANATALAGQGAFVAMVERLQRMPFLPYVEGLAIFAPLAFHAGYGLKLAREGKPNVAAYGTTHNGLYALQRVTGLVTFVFVALHLWELRVQKLLFGMADTSFYDTLAGHLSWTHWGVPWVALAYLVGLASVCFHLANGLWGFAATWGLAVAGRARARVRLASTALGVLLFALGATTVVHFANGWTLGPSDTALPDGPPRPVCAPRTP